MRDQIYYKVSPGRTHAGRISELGATTADAPTAVMASKQCYTRRALLPLTQKLARTKYYWIERLEGFSPVAERADNCRAREHKRVSAMSWDAEPVVGQWYRHLEKGYEFKVVAVDEDEGIVQIQYIDDEVEELDIDSWYEWDIEPIVPYDKSIKTREGITTDDDVDPESDRYADPLDDEPDDGVDELDGWEDR
ncbi:MAG: DUF6763 family protein [Acidiferrobacterales bacterium]